MELPDETWVVERWAAGLADVIHSMIDLRPVVKCSSPVDPGQAGGPSVLWQELSLSLAPEAALIAGAPEQTWLKLGETALRAIGLDEIAAADARSTYLEILTQTVSGLAAAIGKTLGREVTLAGGREPRDPPGAAHLRRVAVTIGDLEELPVFVGLTPALISALSQPQSGEPDLPEEPGARPALPGPAQLESSPPAPLNSRTLDLLMEVELPVSVSFGRARLPLREVLKLTSGCIVELNRAVSEPVELIINGAVIARGEVVVVEGNYGVKIEKIVSRQERLRTLK